MFNIRIPFLNSGIIFSAILAALSVAAMVASATQFGQPMRLGIDFTGGSRFVLKFDRTVSEQDLRAVFTGYGLEGAIVQAMGAPEDNTWQVRTREVTESEVDDLRTALEKIPDGRRAEPEGQDCIAAGVALAADAAG